MLKEESIQVELLIIKVGGCLRRNPGIVPQYRHAILSSATEKTASPLQIKNARSRCSRGNENGLVCRHLLNDKLQSEQSFLGSDDNGLKKIRATRVLRS